MTDLFKPKKINLEDVRKTSVASLMKMDMKVLKDLQKQADTALFKAKLTKDWIDGAINFKLWKESKGKKR
jgi:hypothetical protein